MLLNRVFSLNWSVLTYLVTKARQQNEFAISPAKKNRWILLQHFFSKTYTLNRNINAGSFESVLCHVHFKVPALHDLMKHVFLDYNACNYGTLRYRFIYLCKVMIMIQQMTVILYYQVITSQPKSWCVQMMALLMRSRLEKDSRRKMERSMMQLQVYDV